MTEPQQTPRRARRERLRFLLQLAIVGFCLLLLLLDYLWPQEGPVPPIRLPDPEAEVLPKPNEGASEEEAP